MVLSKQAELVRGEGAVRRSGKGAPVEAWLVDAAAVASQLVQQRKGGRAVGTAVRQGLAVQLRPVQPQLVLPAKDAGAAGAGAAPPDDAQLVGGQSRGKGGGFYFTVLFGD